MRNFQDTFETRKRSFISAFSNRMTVPLSKSVTHKCNDKDIPLVANKNIFSKLTIIMQKRSIDLKEVFKYSLGPFP